MVHHRGTEGTEDAEEDSKGDTRLVIGAAIEVHRHLGPGLLESVYETALHRELSLRGLAVRRQVRLPIAYKGLQLGGALRLDLVVSERVLVEVKAVEVLAPIHRAQLLTYLKLSGLRLGLLINFNVSLLRSGIRRIING
jgi:GxxExxY protein